MEYTREFLEKLYCTMVRIRICEESFVEPILKQEIRCPVHLCCGHEAVAVGVCAALETTDYIFGTHRSHGHFLAKGGSLGELVAEVYCRETGCCRGRGGSMHVISPAHGMLGAAPIVGGTISLAVGAALSVRVLGQQGVAVSFFGDGATGEGVFTESLNFAALHRLPVIFVCENNLYSTHLPLRECRPLDNIVDTALPHGMSGQRIDGNDVLTVYHAALEAVHRCRAGEGPALLECRTYRLRGHVGPSDNIQGAQTDIRPKPEVYAWKKRDPILQFERYLLADGRFTKPQLKRLMEGIREEVALAHESARKSPFPGQEGVSDYVYREEKAPV